jgi:hypothetical protein
MPAATIQFGIGGSLPQAVGTAAATASRTPDNAGAWEQFTRFLAFPPEVKRVAYITNAIETPNAWFRQTTPPPQIGRRLVRPGPLLS